MNFGNGFPYISSLVKATHQEDAQHTALFARTKPCAYHYQISRIGHFAIEQVVFFDFQPMSLSGFVGAFHIFQYQTFQPFLQNLVLQIVSIHLFIKYRMFSCNKVGKIGTKHRNRYINRRLQQRLCEWPITVSESKASILHMVSFLFCFNVIGNRSLKIATTEL